MVECGCAGRLPGVRGSTGAPGCRRHYRPRRHPLAVPLQARGHLVPDGLGGGVHQELLGRRREGGRGSPQYGPRPPGNPNQGVHQGGHYRLPVGRPKHPRRTRVGGRQGARAPGGDVYPAEALPRPQGRVVRYPRRGKRRAGRLPNGGCPRPSGPPDSALTSRGALGSTPGVLTLVGRTYPRSPPTRLGRGRRRRYPRCVGVGGVTQPLTKAYAPAHKAIVAMDKRPGRVALLFANSEGQTGPGSLPVQRLV